MDTDSLSARCEEHFSAFESVCYVNSFGDDFRNFEWTLGDSGGDNIWEWDNEQEYNGDIALIPVCSDIQNSFLSNSPPSKDFSKILNDWQQLVDLQTSDVDDLDMDLRLSISSPEPSAQSETDDNTCNSIAIEEHSEAEIAPTVAINKKELETHRKTFKRKQPGGKKIDVKAQCYVVDSDEDVHVDIETISEHSNSPVLHARDLDSLLEQFEATQAEHYFEPIETNNQKAEVTVPPLKVEEKVTDLNEQNVTDQQNSGEKETEKNKEIINALPEELIQRIKASSKRRPISVIDPIPSKRRGIKRSGEVPPQIIKIKTNKVIHYESVQLDHDYCTSSTPYPKHPKKDSGFESAEEEEHHNILRNQPTVKGADGKIMVSLLKSNTIRSNNTESMNKKRKLNLEEYKKRRENFFRSYENSQSNSPINSGRNSPIVEDENIRRLKHQEKLLQMASEILKTPPKSASKVTTVSIPVEPITTSSSAPPCPRSPPPNIVMKTLVSVGVNTDDSQLVKSPARLLDSKSTNTVKTNDMNKTASKNPTPEEQLEEIKPLLQSANCQISSSSLITSVIENLQNKTKKSSESNATNKDEGNKQNVNQEHGEDKTIIYRSKDSPIVVTRDVEVQTEYVACDEPLKKLSLVKEKPRHRRRSRSDNGHRRRGCRSRNSSEDSVSSSSHSSSYSSSSRSRSRSQSISPVRRRYREHVVEKEKIKEVEERRIIYVGRISKTMSREDLRRRFQRFGPITNVSVHIRDHGDSYGFVTFMYKVDAYEAVEHGNDDPMLPQYDLSFGGRRLFCRTRYADLDNIRDDANFMSSKPLEDSFDNLLREMQAKLYKRKASA